MRIALLGAIIVMISFSCFSPKAILSKQGNTYLYTKIKDKRICFARPHIMSLTTTMTDKGGFFKADSTVSIEDRSVGDAFYNDMKWNAKRLAPEWKELSPSLSDELSKSPGSIEQLSSESLKLLQGQCDYLISIYNIRGEHKQGYGISSSQIGGVSVLEEKGSSSSEFEYDCSILNVQTKQREMHVHIVENGSKSLNFMDTVLEHLYSILLYDGK
jgi:hypothetical protein